MSIKIFLARHGETEWAVQGKHTGRFDIPLTAHGEQEARSLGERLRKGRYATVLTSPLQRAKRTCELAGFGAAAETVPDLMEWNYGDYEGRTAVEVRARNPDWHLFRDGCPGGEQLADVAARVDRVLLRLRAAPSPILVFAHGHLLRVFAMRWAGIPAELGARFSLAPAALSVLSRESEAADPVIERWNDTSHLSAT